MDTHFFALGLKRGSSESDMKKAYHKKALEYHPDRNPNGAEIFKRVQQAYEALQKHYKAHGGLDMGSTVAGGGCSTSSSRTGSTAARDDLDDLFTELQRSTSSTARRYPHRPPRQGSSTASDPPVFEEHHGKAEEARRRAHGPRVPVSAYDPFHGEEDQMDAFVSQAQHFAAMERRKAQLAADVNAGGDGGGAAGKAPFGLHRGAQPPAAETWASSRSTEREAERGASNEPNSAFTSPPSSSSVPNNGASSTASNAASGCTPAASSPPKGRRKGDAGASHCDDSSPTGAATDEASASSTYKPCHQQLSAEWRQMRREAEEERRNQQHTDETARRLRKEQIERETREEWQRLQMEMERKRRTESPPKESIDDALRRVEQQRKTNQQLKELHAERRELKKELLSRRMPGEGELSRMSDQELFVLEGVLEATLSRVQNHFRSRMRSSAPCSACGIATKDLYDRRFSCEHRATCTNCGRACFACPLCGADSLDLMHDE